MTFEKGNTHGKGRPKGSTNKVTLELRHVFQQIIEDNLENVSQAFDQLFQEDPHKALQLYLKCAEFVIPKVRRENEFVPEEEVISLEQAEKIMRTYASLPPLELPNEASTSTS